VSSPRFTFRLERVRALRERAEDLAKEEYASTLAHRMEGAAMLRAAAEMRDRARAAARPGADVALSGADLLANQAWLDRLETARQVAAYVGLCPQERTSGSSVRGRGHIGPLGPASLRKALYLPAIVAMRVNPALRVFAERLRAKGKRPKVVITAVMRKLLLLAWTLLRTGQPFSPTHHVQLAGA
jgi:transposase